MIFFYSIIYIFKEQEFKIINFRDTLKLQENRNLNNGHNIRPKIKNVTEYMSRILQLFFKEKPNRKKSHFHHSSHSGITSVSLFESSQSSILLHVDDVGTARRS